MVAALLQQNVKMARLLPHTGIDVFRPFTLESLAEIERRMAEAAAEQEQMKAQNIEVAEEDLPKPSSDLEAGKSLPFIYGDPPPKLLNVPVEELDPFYKAQKVSGKSKIAVMSTFFLQNNSYSTKGVLYLFLFFRLSSWSPKGKQYSDSMLNLPATF